MRTDTTDSFTTERHRKMAYEKGKILIYSSDDGAIEIDVRLADEYW